MLPGLGTGLTDPGEAAEREGGIYETRIFYPGRSADAANRFGLLDPQRLK